MTKPEQVFKVGAVRASIFRNTIQKGGKTIPLPKVVLEVRYKDKEGNWKGTHSFSLNELPKARLALQKAYDYLLVKSRKERDQDDASQSEKPSKPQPEVVKIGDQPSGEGL